MLLFKKALVLLLGLGGAIFLWFTVFPEFFTSFFLGTKFAPLAHLLPRLSVATFIASIANLLFFYFLALREHRISYAAVAGALGTLITLYLSHETPIDIVNAFIIGSGVSLVLLGVLLTLRHTDPQTVQ